MLAVPGFIGLRKTYKQHLLSVYPAAVPGFIGFLKNQNEIRFQPNGRQKPLVRAACQEPDKLRPQSCGFKAVAVSKLRADETVAYSGFLIEAPHFVQNDASSLTAAPQAGQVSSETSGAGIFSPQPGQN